MSQRQPSRTTPALPRFAAERIVRANGVDLCVQSAGDRADPAILLIAGAAGSMLDWAEAFCQRLAAGSRFVIRYDHRDTGRSVSYPPGAPRYTGRDLDEDAIGVLDACGVATAHLVGISMGGGIAQSLAVHHPDRVATLTLISTTSIGADARDRDLPPPSEAVKAGFGAAAPDWSDRAAVIDYVAAQYRPFTARSRPVAEAFIRDLATRTVDRAVSIASMNNHWVLDQGDSTPVRLAEISAPTLVVHGTEDPLFPLPHGIALAQDIPGARLLTLEHTGHELPPAVWDTVIPAILEHTAPNSRTAPTRSRIGFCL
jgi:pimeloyl-ACP methyl ester carboxylesterase